MSIENIYQYVYLIVATLILLHVLRKQQLPIDEEDEGYNKTSYLCLLVVAILTFVIGNRPVSVGSDTTQYMQTYVYYKGAPFKFIVNPDNIIFDNLFAYFGSLGLNINVFFILMATLYFGCMYLACRKLFPQNQEIAFFSYIVAFSTFSYGVDGIKSGVAASIFLMALANRERKWLSVLLAVVSAGFHHSMIVVVYAYIISYFYRYTKVFFYGWLFALLIAVAHIDVFQFLFAGYVDTKGQDYLLKKIYVTGFRPDFILYSAMPILVGYYMIFKEKIQNEMYELWLRMYLTTNSVWMLCMYASYTNRIAYLSWFMYPIVLLMPFYAIQTTSDQLEVGRKVVLYHLLFTLFMVIIYYGLLSS